MNGVEDITRGKNVQQYIKNTIQFPIMPSEKNTQVSDEDRRMGLGTSAQATPEDTLELHITPSEITTFGEDDRIEQDDRSVEPVNTPVRVSTHKTIRIKRKNFRSPGASMIPSGTVDISEGEISPTKKSSRKENLSEASEQREDRTNADNPKQHW